jgi:hypothetical protein
VRKFVGSEVAALLEQPLFGDAIFGFLRADATSQARATTVVLPRLRAISNG